MRISKIKLEVDGVGTGKEAFLCNADLLPTPPSKRTWNKVTYSLFWFAEQASVTSWTVASTGISLGLSWWETWLCVILGRIVITFFMVMSGRPGMVYKIPFPVIVRSSFGVYGGFWPFFNRNAMTIIWCAILHHRRPACWLCDRLGGDPAFGVCPHQKLQQGGRLEDLADAGVAAHFPHLVSRRGARRGLHHDQEDSHGRRKQPRVGFSGADVHPGRPVRHVRSEQLRPDQKRCQEKRRPVHADDSRADGIDHRVAARHPRHVDIGEDLRPHYLVPDQDPRSVPDHQLLGEEQVRRLLHCARVLHRKAVTQLFANIIAGGNDTAALCPKYINIRRGAIIVMVLSFAITPWNLTKTSFSFTTYLSSYQIFLSGILGIVISDFFFVRKGRYELADLYSGKKDGIYYYTYGINWRDYVAYFISWGPVFPGFLHACGNTHISLGAVHLYIFALPIGIFIGGAAYYVLCAIFPPAGGIRKTWDEVDPEFVNDRCVLHGMETQVFEAASASGEKVDYVLRTMDA
ncbi:hypothetical protein KL915_002901 [Ogataea haglerorum]|nr:hypothetical protein KL915_002901 [Ogataea haglerorum]